jgi:hypothetical protein
LVPAIYRTQQQQARLRDVPRRSEIPVITALRGPSAFDAAHPAPYLRRVSLGMGWDNREDEDEAESAGISRRGALPG